MGNHWENDKNDMLKEHSEKKYTNCDVKVEWPEKGIQQEFI